MSPVKNKKLKVLWEQSKEKGHSEKFVSHNISLESAQTSAKVKCWETEFLLIGLRPE